MKWWVKYWIKKLSPFPLSKNHYYDILTKKLIKKHCTQASNCIDVGCHRGEVLDIFLKVAPNGKHFAFEPIPYLYNYLVLKYNKNKNCHIYKYAVSNTEGKSQFNHVITNPSYSGLKKRKYDSAKEKDEILLVEKKTLDSLIPGELKIDFLKIDTEGGDFDVLLGATNLIRKYRPYIITEFGLGGSEIYGANPDLFFNYLNEINYKISLLNLPDVPLTLPEFKKQYQEGKNYYFFLDPRLKV